MSLGAPSICAARLPASLASPSRWSRSAARSKGRWAEPTPARSTAVPRETPAAGNASGGATTVPGTGDDRPGTIGNHLRERMHGKAGNGDAPTPAEIDKE